MAQRKHRSYPNKNSRIDRIYWWRARFRAGSDGERCSVRLTTRPRRVRAGAVSPLPRARRDRAGRAADGAAWGPVGAARCLTARGAARRAAPVLAGGAGGTKRGAAQRAGTGGCRCARTPGCCTVHGASRFPAASRTTSQHLWTSNMQIQLFVVGGPACEDLASCACARAERGCACSPSTRSSGRNHNGACRRRRGSCMSPRGSGTTARLPCAR